MRILYVWDSEYPWDIRTHKICAALSEAGHEIHLIARNRRGLATRERRPEASVHRMRPLTAIGARLDALSSFPAFVNPRWVRLVTEVARAVDPEVIVVRDLPLCPTAIWVGRRLRKPVVLDMAENYPAMIRDVWTARRQTWLDFLVRNPRIVALVERHCVARVDHVLVVVRESGERLRELGVPADRISIVSNTPARARAEGGSRRESGTPMRVVYLGLMETPRGVGEALEAVHLLRGRGRRVQLRLIGDGRDLDRFRQSARSLGLGCDSVDVLGYVPNERALEIVAECDVGLVPHHASESWNTTIPNKLFDYMAAGLPVVSSDAVPCARVVRETGAGLVFQSGDPASLADALSSLLDPAVRRRLGEAGRKAVLETYHWERDVEILLGALHAAVAAERVVD